MSKEKLRNEWYTLDNAAKIYPSTTNSRWNSVYRCAVVLNNVVDKKALQMALDATIKRYPTYNVSLRKGVFWYYFQGCYTKPKIESDNYYPCRNFNFKAKQPMFRVLYGRNRISVEIFHSLADGYGGMNFLNTLLLRYFTILGEKIQPDGILHYEEVPKEEEIEDSYKRYYSQEAVKTNRVEESAYHINGIKEIDGVLNVIHGEVPTDQLKSLAKNYNVTINQLVVGVLAYVCYKRKIYDAKKQRKKPIKINIAINLRKMFPSVTLRNFSSILNVTLDETVGKELSFDEVLNIMTENYKNALTKEAMDSFIKANYEIEKNLAIRFVPLFLKRIVMKIALYKVGEDLYTTVVSNLGVVQTPEQFKDLISRYEVIIGQQRYNHDALSLVSFNNKTVFTFSRNIKSSSIEREFFRFFTDKGIDLLIGANRGGNEHE